MNVQPVDVRHVELVDGHHDKFYRIYTMRLPTGAVEVRQWGRRGTTGQFKVLSHSNLSVANGSAGKQLDAKQRKGYGPSYGFMFDFDTDRWNGDGKVLATVAEGTERFQGERPEPVPEAVKANGSPLEAFAERALRAITVSVSSPGEAAVEFAALQSEWGEIEERVTKARDYLDTLEDLIAN